MDSKGCREKHVRAHHRILHRQWRGWTSQLRIERDLSGLLPERISRGGSRGFIVGFPAIVESFTWQSSSLEAGTASRRFRTYPTSDHLGRHRVVIPADKDAQSFRQVFLRAERDDVTAWHNVELPFALSRHLYVSLFLSPSPSTTVQARPPDSSPAENPPPDSPTHSVISSQLAFSSALPFGSFQCRRPSTPKLRPG